jgi:hypothetical protein
MKKFIVLLTICLFLTIGCEQTSINRSHRSHVVTLYSSDGKIIQQWEGHFYVVYNQGFVVFRDKGKRVILSGTVTVADTAIE